MEPESYLYAKINYYCREKLFCHMKAAVEEGLQRHSGDPILKFFLGAAIIFDGRLQEGMRVLDGLAEINETSVCTILALIYAQKKSRIRDEEAIQALETTLSVNKRTVNDVAFYYAALFLFHTGNYNKAREYIDESLKISDDNKNFLILNGWIELLGSKPEDALSKRTVKNFDDAMLGNRTSPNLDALFGKCRYFYLKHNYTGALQMMNEAVVTYPKFEGCLVEKMKIQLALKDWDQTLDSSHRALTIDSFCIEGLRHQCMHCIAVEGRFADAKKLLEELLHAISMCEKTNSSLLHDTAYIFSRVCSRRPEVLHVTITMLEKAIELQPQTAMYHNELAEQHVLLGDHAAALLSYKNALKLDAASVEALAGIIHVQLLDGQLDEAENQLVFLKEVQESIGSDVQLMYLNAVHMRKCQRDSDQMMKLLNDCVEKVISSIKGMPMSLMYLKKLNPEFLIRIAKEYLALAPPTPGVRNASDIALKRCSALLLPLCQAIPACIEGLYLSGKVKFLLGDFDGASNTVKKCLSYDETYSDGYLILAETNIQKQSFLQASQCLEKALSHNFAIREHPIYHLHMAKIQRHTQSMADAIQTIKTALKLPCFKQDDARKKQYMPDQKNVVLSGNEKMQLYLELADTYMASNNIEEASEVMIQCQQEFKGTDAEIKITLANAELALQRGDTDTAVNMLRNVPKTDSSYVKAREKIAHIYLHHLKEPRMYARIYRELVENNPTPESYLMLGDAYMSIQEPEKAIEVYEEALKRNPRDGSLARKIGKALIKTHNYGKAISYYEAALKTGAQNFLRYDLAELYLKLRQFDKAEKVAKQALESDMGSDDLNTMMDMVKYFIILSQIYRKAGQPGNAILSLNKGKEMQSRVLRKVKFDRADVLPEQNELAGNICIMTAEYYKEEQQYQKAIDSYRDALDFVEDTKTMLSLCSMYTMTGELDMCQQQCIALLNKDPDSTEANVMMAEIKLRKSDFEAAIHHFQQMLEKCPTHYQIMEKMVEICRRVGTLEKVPDMLKRAEKTSARVKDEAGFNFCTGMYHWRIGDANTALKDFNKARKDVEWGRKATLNMIEICLNPDNEIIGGEALQQEGDSKSGSKDANSDILKTAEKLFNELKFIHGDTRAEVIHNYYLIITKVKENLDQALNNFVEMAKKSPVPDRENVPALLGMATAYMVLKQVPRARNQLKRVSKVSWTLDDADDLERSWLLLCDIYIQTGKYDMATDLLKKILQHNKSCCKGYEYMGFIMEKEQSYRDAAEHYEQARKFGNQNNPVIGYKLAFNYLKAKRYTDAIDVCNHVLFLFPDYPKIRTEILEKARALIRM